MKFSIERAALLKAVSQAQSVVERRNTIPILANVLIEASGDQVSFRATDLDIEVVDQAPAKVERAGATTVSAVTLHEIVRKLPDGSLVSMTDDGASGRLTVEAGRSNFALATLPREDFPVMATSEYEANFSAPAPVLRRLFDKSKYGGSEFEVRAIDDPSFIIHFVLCPARIAFVGSPLNVERYSRDAFASLPDPALHRPS